MSEQHLTRRRFIGGATLAGVGVLLAACGGAANQAASAVQQAQAGTETASTAATSAAATTASATQAAAAKAPAAGTATVNWLVRTDPVENKGQEQIFEPALKKAGIAFNRIIIPSKEYIPKINSLAAAKESLEIWGFGGNYMDYWARGLSEPLDQYIGADKWDIDNYFLPGLPDIYKVKGKHYGLNQLTCYGSNIVYNKALLDQAGLAPPPADPADTSWTFDKLIEYGQKLTKNYGKPDAVYGVSYSLWDRMTSISYLGGDDSWTPEHYQNFIAPKSNFANQANIDGHQLRHDMIYKYQIHPDPSIDQGLNQFANPFKTGKLGIVLDGGWQYWTTADITEFKYGFAAVPHAKTNKTIVFDDFWIMGRWSSNKENAWKALRVLTDADVATNYSLLSGTPPTVRAATGPWIKKIADRTGQSVEDLTKLTQGSIEKSRVQESPDHLFLQHPKIDDTYTNETDPFWANKDAVAAKVWPDLTKKMDDVVLAIYNQFKDAMPKE